MQVQFGKWRRDFKAAQGSLQKQMQNILIIKNNMK